MLTLCCDALLPEALGNLTSHPSSLFRLLDDLKDGQCACGIMKQFAQEGQHEERAAVPVVSVGLCWQGGGQDGSCWSLQWLCACRGAACPGSTRVQWDLCSTMLLWKRSQWQSLVTPALQLMIIKKKRGFVSRVLAGIRINVSLNCQSFPAVGGGGRLGVCK